MNVRELKAELRKQKVKYRTNDDGDVIAELDELLRLVFEAGYGSGLEIGHDIAIETAYKRNIGTNYRPEYRRDWSRTADLDHQHNMRWPDGFDRSSLLSWVSGVRIYHELNRACRQITNTLIDMQATRQTLIEMDYDAGHIPAAATELHGRLSELREARDAYLED